MATAKKVTVYHNPVCGKSRGALEILDQRGIDHEVIEYLKSPLDRATLEHFLDLLPGAPAELLRKDKRFKELALNEADYQTRAGRGRPAEAPGAHGASRRDPRWPGDHRATVREGARAVRLKDLPAHPASEPDEHATSYAPAEDGSLLHGGALVFFDGPIERLDVVRAVARAA